jgi:DNA repair photolyase
VADQLDLFASHEPLPKQLGHAAIHPVEARGILTKASGFMAGYDYTLNPYSGCSYGCTYCYAAFFARDEEKQDTWGEWVEVKENALGLLRRMRTDLAGKTVYMSSVTDPYQPIERKAKLVRELLKEMAPRGVRLVVQTRSPLVVRDIDIFRQFEAVQVNMTVTTDSETVRRVYEPHCATTEKRLAAIREVNEAGIPTMISLTPLLPIEDPHGFAAQLLGTGVKKFVVQPFHPDRGRFVRGTREEALRVTREMSWTEESYREAVAVLKEKLFDLSEGKEGFAPA